MAAARKLKVFRTAIGFHDAYVAVPSKKAALAAWGAQNDLFAIGAAELITDPELTREALASPGQVIRASRGSPAEHLREVARTAKPPRFPASSPAKVARPTARTTKPKPPPSRQHLEEPEQALERFEAAADAELADLRNRERKLAQARTVAEARLEKERADLEQRLAKAREKHERAIRRWRELP